MLPSTAYLAVSLFNEKLEGEALRGHVREINKLRFSDCVVSLGDSLHRFNLPLEADGADERHARAVALGNDWLERNSAVLAELEPPWRVMRHDEMLAQDDFARVHEALTVFIAERPVMATDLGDDAKAFVGRRGLEGVDAEASSRAYILEELAADIAFAQHRSYTYIYPGGPPRIYQAVQHASGPAVLGGLERCVFVPTKVRSNGRVKVPRWARSLAEGAPQRLRN